MLITPLHYHAFSKNRKQQTGSTDRLPTYIWAASALLKFASTKFHPCLNLFWSRAFLQGFTTPGTEHATPCSACLKLGLCLAAHLALLDQPASSWAGLQHSHFLAKEDESPESSVPHFTKYCCYIAYPPVGPY